MYVQVKQSNAAIYFLVAYRLADSSSQLKYAPAFEIGINKFYTLVSPTVFCKEKKFILTSSFTQITFAYKSSELVHAYKFTFSSFFFTATHRLETFELRLMEMEAAIVLYSVSV